METNEKREKNYWGYRIDVKNQDFFFKELEQGRLRQGWGYAENQKLPDTTDSGARKNLSMYKNVKKGDILFARSGATVGKNYIHLVDEKSIYAGYLIKFTADTNEVLCKYVYHCVNNSMYEKFG